jgi:hypothetical protein
MRLLQPPIRLGWLKRRHCSGRTMICRLLRHDERGRDDDPRDGLRSNFTRPFLVSELDNRIYDPGATRRGVQTPSVVVRVESSTHVGSQSGVVASRSGHALEHVHRRFSDRHDADVLQDQDRLTLWRTWHEEAAEALKTR